MEPMQRWRGRLTWSAVWGSSLSIRILDFSVSSQWREHGREVRKENFGEVKVEAGSTVLDEVLGLEGAKFSQEGVTVRLESG